MLLESVVGHWWGIPAPALLLPIEREAPGTDWEEGCGVYGPVCRQRAAGLAGERQERDSGPTVTGRQVLGATAPGHQGDPTPPSAAGWSSLR